MKKIRILSLILCVVLIGSLLQISVSAEEESTAGSGCNTLDATTAYLGTAQLVQNMQAAFLYEKNSDTVMYAWNPDLSVFPSSLVKIITAFMAVQYGNVDDMVTVSEEALAKVPYDAVSAKLQVGEVISLGDLIYCMLVGSANDAASVIAMHVSGTEAAFVERMNDFVTELGCTATILKNPHGLHDPEQISTARDIVRILTAATENELFMKYFSAAAHTVPATNMSEERELSSTNLLLNHKAYLDERATGGRTGIAEDGTRCLAATAQLGGLDIVSVVLGSKTINSEEGKDPIYGGFKETTALYDLVFGQYEIVKVLYEGQAIRQTSVLNGDSDVILGSQTEVSAVLPAGVKQEELVFRYSNLELEAPIEAGEKLANVEVWHGNMCIAEAELSAMNSVRSVLYAKETESEKKSGAAGIKAAFSIIGVIAIVAIITALALFLYARAKKARHNGHTKRYRRDRRRSR